MGKTITTFQMQVLILNLVYKWTMTLFYGVEFDGICDRVGGFAQLLRMHGAWEF